MGFLVVDREVFQARSHALALDASTIAAANRPATQGVLGQVLKFRPQWGGA